MNGEPDSGSGQPRVAANDTAPTLDYATPPRYQASAKKPSTWRMSATTRSLWFIGITLILGLMTRADIGSGIEIENPLRYIAAAVVLFNAFIYVVSRIDAEPLAPAWAKYSMVLLTVFGAAMAITAYASWNYLLVIPRNPDAWFWPALYLLAACIVLFSVLRAYLFIALRRRQHSPAVR